MNIWLVSKIKRYSCVILVSFLFSCSTGTTPVHVLSERDMKNPTILANKGWDILGYGGWFWNLAEGKTTTRLISSRTYFKMAIDLDPGNADAYAGLARIIQIRGYIPQTVVKFKKDECQKALDLIENAPIRDTNNFNIYYMKSELRLCLEDYDGAIREAELLQGISDTCLVHILKSMAYYEKYRLNKKTSDKDMATLEGTDFMESVQNRNLNYNGLEYINLKNILQLSKDYHSTIEYFKSNLESKPQSKWPYSNYVWILLQRGTLDDLDKAEETIDKAKKVINYDIDPMRLYSQRGEKYYELKQYEKAYNDYSKLSALNAYGVSREKLTNICSKLNAERCNKTWQMRIKKYTELGDCYNAAEEFNAQYSLYPQAFEPLKDAVAQCKTEKK